MASGELTPTSSADDPLERFLRAERAQGWDWSRNCVIWVADYICACTGVDPAAGVRARLSDEESCRRVIAEEGGFMPAIGYAMDEAGFARTQSPTRGDAAVVYAPVTRDELARMPALQTIGAIVAGPRTPSGNPLVVVRSRLGLRWTRLPVVAAWRIG